ncbi:MAG: succinate dehydrogenase assembly factor 2, partial [bacterium]
YLNLSDPEFKKVLWRCRRGTKELDLILGRFAEDRYTSLNQDLKRQFDRLLKMQDPILTEWLCFHQKPDMEVADIVKKILEKGSN